MKGYKNQVRTIKKQRISQSFSINNDTEEKYQSQIKRLKTRCKIGEQKANNLENYLKSG